MFTTNDHQEIKYLRDKVTSVSPSLQNSFLKLIKAYQNLLTTISPEIRAENDIERSLKSTYSALAGIPLATDVRTQGAAIEKAMEVLKISTQEIKDYGLIKFAKLVKFDLEKGEKLDEMMDTNEDLSYQSKVFLTATEGQQCTACVML